MSRFDDPEQYFDYVRLSAKLAETEPLLTAQEFRDYILKPGAFTIELSTIPVDSDESWQASEALLRK
jgi:hypothetical protein